MKYSLYKLFAGQEALLRYKCLNALRTSVIDIRLFHLHGTSSSRFVLITLVERKNQP